MGLGSLIGVIYPMYQNRYKSLTNVAVKKLLDAIRHANVHSTILVEVNANDHDLQFLHDLLNL